MVQNPNPKKRIALLGSTGSIGTQALEVIDEHTDLFEVEILTAHHNADLLIKQAIKYRPNAVVIVNEQLYQKVADVLLPLDIKVYAGTDALNQVVSFDSVDMVLLALVGYSGLHPTIHAIKAGKPIALANKETLVVAGDIIMNLAAQNKVPLLPVDSEHSAIFQCLAGEYADIECIYLTASGGPFLNTPFATLEKVSAQQALKHPRWDMGAKITIDSASMMNKGFEVIEAHWLFSLKPKQIKVLVHPQSVIHSMVQFTDGSIKAQLGEPSMKLPIQYAFSYPIRIPNTTVPRVNFNQYPLFNFQEVDTQKFPCLTLAYEALNKKGNTACVINAANEIAVELFLRDQLKFTHISTLIEQTLARVSYVSQPTIDDYCASNAEARAIATELSINL